DISSVWRSLRGVKCEDELGHAVREHRRPAPAEGGSGEMPPLTPARDETTTRAGGRQSALERGLLRLARVGLVLQLVLIILVVITASQVGGDGLRATNTRQAD